MSARAIVSWVPIVFFLSGCATPIFHAERIGSGYTVPRDGILYALPRGFVDMTIERKIEQGKTPELVVTLTEPLFVPDEDHLFFLQYRHAALSSDNVAVQTNEKGLLTEVTTTTKDPVPAAVRELANFIVGVATEGIAAAPVPTLERVAEPPMAFKVRAIFDPARVRRGCELIEDGTRETNDDPCAMESLVSLKAFLRQRDISLDVERPPLLGASDANLGTGCNTKVCYRFVLPYRIAVTDRHSQGSNSRAEALVLLPNEGPVGGIEVVRRNLVENKFILTFNNGILTKAHYDDPSQLIGALSIPIDALKAIVSIPSALFRFTIARQTDIAELNAEKALLQAQTELAAQQLQLLQAQQALKKAESGEAVE